MVSPHYTPTGNPRNDIPSSSERFRQEYLRIESGLQAMTVMPIVLKMKDANDAAAVSGVSVVIPLAGVLTDVSAVLHAANLTQRTDLSTFVTNAAGKVVVNQFFIRVALDAAIGETFLNPFAQNENPIEDRTVAPGDIIQAIANGLQGSVVMPVTFTWWLTRT